MEGKKKIKPWVIRSMKKASSPSCLAFTYLMTRLPSQGHPKSQKLTTLAPVVIHEQTSLQVKSLTTGNNNNDHAPSRTSDWSF